jgi:hypothetical protein
MHGVSDDFVDHPAVIDHDAGNALEILVERCHQIFGVGAMRRRGETLDVGEQCADLTSFAIELDPTDEGPLRSIGLFDGARAPRGRRRVLARRRP